MSVATAIELFHQDGKPSGIWYCSECRAVHADQRVAQSCHGVTHCGDCGVELGKRQPYYRKKCAECDSKERRASQAKQEFERYTKAVKIMASEYTGPQVFFGDQFFETVEDAIDDCDEPPEYIWAVKDIGLQEATMEDLVGRIIAEGWEDMEVNDLNGTEDLQKAIDVFNEANSGIPVYTVDHGVAIVLDESVLAEWRAEREG